MWVVHLIWAVHLCAVAKCVFFYRFGIDLAVLIPNRVWVLRVVLNWVCFFKEPFYLIKASKPCLQHGSELGN